MMDSFEILYGGDSAQVKHVFANADVPRPAALACSNVTEAMFDSYTLAQLHTAGFGGLQDSKFLLQSLVCCDAHSPALAVCGVRALSAQVTWAADFRVELDDISRLEVLGLSGRTCNGLA